MMSCISCMLSFYVHYLWLFLFVSLQEDVDTFMAKEDNASAQDVIKRLDEQLNKYKFMEVHLQARRKKWVTVVILVVKQWLPLCKN